MTKTSANGDRITLFEIGALAVYTSIKFGIAYFVIGLMAVGFFDGSANVPSLIVGLVDLLEIIACFLGLAGLALLLTTFVMWALRSLAHGARRLSV
jgi:hypothetical protein